MFPVCGRHASHSCRKHTISLATHSSRLSVPSTKPQLSPPFTRGIRQKRRTANIEKDLRREELWLEKLQRDLVKARTQLEKENASGLAKWWNKKALNDPEQATLLEDVNTWYWKHVLTTEERSKLEKYGVRDFDEFCSIYETAKTDELLDVDHESEVWDKYIFIIDTFEEVRQRLIQKDKELDAPSNNFLETYLKSNS